MKDGENCLMFFKNKNEKNRKTNKITIKIEADENDIDILSQ